MALPHPHNSQLAQLIVSNFLRIVRHAQDVWLGGDGAGELRGLGPAVLGRQGVVAGLGGRSSGPGQQEDEGDCDEGAGNSHGAWIKGARLCVCV